jgi:hypothetical protein
MAVCLGRRNESAPTGLRLAGWKLEGRGRVQSGPQGERARGAIVRAAALRVHFCTRLQVGALVAKGADIVKVQIGEPDFLTPTPIVEETKRCLDGEVLQETGTTRTGYSHPSGTHGLKAKLANYMNERGEVIRPVAGEIVGIAFRSHKRITRRGQGVGPEHIVIGPGCKPGIFLSPYWPPCRRATRSSSL